MNRLGMLVDIAHVSKDTMLDVLGGRPEKWEGSIAPIIFSHSSAYALCPHPRNVQDDVLQLVKVGLSSNIHISLINQYRSSIKITKWEPLQSNFFWGKWKTKLRRLLQKTNSIVMVNFAPEFISCTASNSSTGLPDFYPLNSTLHQAARHIMHIGNTIGFDHVGIGSDFDGIPNTPEGLEDVSKFPDLIAELLKLGVTDEDAAKVVDRNILRVWADVDSVAARLQREGVLPAEDTIAD